MELATRRPELVFRNPEKIEQGWEQMRQDRATLVEFFGRDELVLPPAEATERLNAYYRHRQEAVLAGQPARRRPGNLPGIDVPAFELPPDLAEVDTIGIIYDETDGLNFYYEYGMLRDLFANPALAADKRYADVLRGYLRSETIAPLPTGSPPSGAGLAGRRWPVKATRAPASARAWPMAKPRPLVPPVTSAQTPWRSGSDG
jgi:hypothetical protein